jgi:hypothetical protein
LESSTLRWTLWQYSIIAATLLSVLFLAGVATSFTARLPRQPEPRQSRIWPISVKGKEPFYASPGEKRTWEVAQYSFISTIGLFFITVASNQYLKGKQRRRTSSEFTPTI